MATALGYCYISGLATALGQPRACVPYSWGFKWANGHSLGAAVLGLCLSEVGYPFWLPNNWIATELWDSAMGIDA
ncbi:hypothetical protein U1Q18_008327, partial [Sarracenia purpurea var. burkii]